MADQEIKDFQEIEELFSVLYKLAMLHITTSPPTPTATSTITTSTSCKSCSKRRLPFTGEPSNKTHHTVDKKGPTLNGLFGRQFGTTAGCSDSAANKNMAVTWEEGTLYDYLINPKKPDDSPTVPKLNRASTATSSTLDTLLREDLDTNEDKLLHSAKKLKRMKDCSMVEVRHWGGQVILEGHSGSEETNHEVPKDVSETETEEVPAAQVNKTGDFIIQFNCPFRKPDDSPTVPKLNRASTAPSSTLDTLLREDLDNNEDKFLHSAKKLKRMKDCMVEASHGGGQVILEDHSGSEETNHEVPKVNKTGDFIIQFKCPCRKPDDSPTVPKLNRASTAPSSTLDTLLREDLDTNEDKLLHSAKKLKGMKDCSMVEVRHWGGQVILEDHSGSEENNHEVTKDGSKTETEEVPAARVDKAGDCFIIEFKCACRKKEAEKEAEEKISVERIGNWIVVTTKCPCQKGYRVHLSGGKACYYQLI